MISDDIKKLLKDHTEDLKNNNLDPIFDELYGFDSFDIMQEFKDLLIDQGIDLLRYVTKIPCCYYYDINDSKKENFNLSDYDNIIGLLDNSFCAVLSTKSKIILPRNLKSFGFLSFYRVASPSIEIPSIIVKIPDYCFNLCTITNLLLPESVLTLGINVFNNSKIDNLYLPNNLSLVYTESFDNFRGLIIYKNKSYRIGYNTAELVDFLQALKDSGIWVG